MHDFTQANAPVVQTEAFMDAGNPDQECQQSRSLLEVTQFHLAQQQDARAELLTSHRIKACSTCAGDLDRSRLKGEARCMHGDAVERAFRALVHVDAERAAAKERRAARLPATLQEAGEAFDLAGKREGVSGTYVRQLMKIRDSGRDDLMQEVVARKKRIDEAARELVVAGGDDDPDTWLTPERILGPARSEAGGAFDLDPATLIRNDGTNPSGAREAYAKNRSDDGLALSWLADRAGRAIRTIWVNPPYSDIAPWVDRAIKTVRENPDMRIWMLIPAATGTGYGQAALRGASAVCFLRGRVKHLRLDGSMKGAPEFDSMIVGFGAASCEKYAEFGVVLPGCAAIQMREAA